MLGDGRFNGNLGNQQKRYDTAYYSPLRIRNYADKNAITISYSGGLMRIAISVQDETGKWQEQISAALTPKKAAVLVDQMIKFEAGEDGAFGTVMGMSEVQTAIAFQMANGIRHLRIAKVNSDGSIQDQKTFKFAQGADAGMRWSDFDTMKYTKEYNDDLDYQMLKNAIIDFSRNMSGASAYSGLYMNRYYYSSEFSKLNAALEKLGVPVNTNRNIGGGFFSGNNSQSQQSATSSHRSYEDMLNSVVEDEDEE